MGSSSSSHYTPPLCAPFGFYCPDAQPASLLCRWNRRLRCTKAGHSEQPLCIKETYQHCDYNATKDSFNVWRYSTPLASSGSSSRNILNCLKFNCPRRVRTVYTEEGEGLVLYSLAKPRLHTRREGLDNCLYASCAALHEIVQPNQIADRGNVTYAHIPPPTLCQSAIYTVE